ncbi:hypothetical protein TNCV_79211 [Trichonephila clavipes]|nr:hypothetical protein TNCV_79211 [Trichonephila clavipes]
MIASEVRLRCSFSFTKTQMKLAPEPDEIINMSEAMVDRASQINLEVGSDHVQKPLDSHHQALKIDEFREMHD